MSSDNPFELSSDSYGDRSEVDYDSTGIEVSARTIQLLTETRPWVTFIGVLSWIAVVFMGLISLFAVGGALFSGQMVMILFTLPYLIGTIVTGVIAKALTTYAGKISSLVATERLSDLEDAMAAQKTYWKTVGIITVIYIGFVVLIFVGAAAFGVMLGSGGF